jgi:hypothetical protein
MSIVTYNNRSIANISAVPGAAKSLTLIKTLTASSSATLSFVDGSSDVVLDSTYPIYVFKFINIHAQIMIKVVLVKCFYLIHHQQHL